MGVDPSADARYRLLLEQVWEPLQRYLRRRTEDADDVLAETALTLWRRLDDVPADASLAWRDWKESQNPPKDANDKKPAESKAAFEKAILATPRDVCQNAVDDLKAAQAEFDALDRVLDTTMGRLAPGLSGIREALGQCLTLAEQVLAQKGPAPAVAAPAEPEPDAPASAAPEAAGPIAAPASPRPTTRAQLYQQIADTSAALKRLEPHSPIPYLLERAVELGALSFPELMKVLVRNPDVLTMMNRELGIDQENPG